MTGAPDTADLLGLRLAAACGLAARLEPVAVGPTPRTAAWTGDGVTLWRYGPASSRAVPLLVVYSLVNRPYLLDLEPGRSLIGGLVERGHSVYLIDWGTPGREARERSLEDYIAGSVGACVDRVCALERVRALDLLGVCQGGTFALCYAALAPSKVRRLVTMVTPVDFATPGDRLAAYARAIDVSLLREAYGNVPGEFLRLAFQAMKPYATTVGKLLALAAAGDDERRLSTHLRVERWISDSPDQAGRAVEEFIEQFYRRNALVRGELSLAGRRLSLKDVTMPLLNVYASRDHLVPPAAALALCEHAGSKDCRALAFDGGHTAVFVSERAQREIPAAVSAFLTGRASAAPRKKPRRSR